jgi:phosphatidylglycerol:prolipoprotein diacylglycerol transferase
MYPILQVGPLAIQVPGLVVIAGLWLGLSLTERHAKIHGQNTGEIYNLVFIVLIAGIVGARLSYAVTYPSAFSANPWSLASINPGLFDPLAGALIGCAAAVIFIYRKKIPLWVMLDALAPLFVVLAIAQGVAHLASGDAFGSPTELPWGIYLWGAVRHPTQMYEIGLAIINLLIVLSIDRFPVGKVPGSKFLSFLALYAGSRLFLEAFRGDSNLILGGLRSAQIISWFVLAVCLVLLDIRIQKVPSQEKTTE